MANWGNTRITQDNVKIIEHERVEETNPEVYKLRGDKFASEGSWDEAEKEYLTAIKLRESAVATTRDEAYSYYRYHRDLFKMYYKSERKDFEEKADESFYSSYYWDARKYKKYEKTINEAGSFKDIKNVWHESMADVDEGTPITMLVVGLVLYLGIIMMASFQNVSVSTLLLGLVPVMPMAFLSEPRRVFKAKVRMKGISLWASYLVFLLYVFWVILMAHCL